MNIFFSFCGGRVVFPISVRVPSWDRGRNRVLYGVPQLLLTFLTYQTGTVQSFFKPFLLSTLSKEQTFETFYERCKHYLFKSKIVIYPSYLQNLYFLRFPLSILLHTSFIISILTATLSFGWLLSLALNAL